MITYRVIVNHQYAYETNLILKVGDKVVLPTPSWLLDVQEKEWIGTVTSLKSDYTGSCVEILRKEI